MSDVTLCRSHVTTHIAATLIGDDRVVVVGDRAAAGEDRAAADGDRAAAVEGRSVGVDMHRAGLGKETVGSMPAAGVGVPQCGQPRLSAVVR